MKKIYTPEQLFDILAEDIIWRKKELSYIRSLIQTSKVPGTQRDGIIRSGIALLYAHWEGFVKEAATAYLRFVATQSLPYTDLSPNFIALAMKKMLNEAGDTNKSIIHQNVCIFFISRLGERSRIPWEDMINTKGNLSSEVLQDILYVLGLDYSPYETKAAIIDEKLLRVRNNVAHGKYLPIDNDDFLNLYEEIIPLLDLIFNQIINAAVSESYRR